MGATEELVTEHRAIERMLAVLEAAAQRLEAAQRVRPNLFREAADFVRNFADRCHHGKEEENLFPRLEQRGVPSGGGPIGVMLFEHEEGRGFIGAIEAAIPAYERGDPAAGRAIAENALAYVELLRGHIWKEENVLFPMADQVLSAEDQDDLTERFERVETEVMGQGVHERYHELLDALEREMALA
ncbi:MAG TPA: hemerythrin domain-containing protein [Dehalococcoidia bacterium]|nr:hemerythrin domain-containing protein [Dehalococcoidia bacterium]